MPTKRRKNQTLKKELIRVVPGIKGGKRRREKGGDTAAAIGRAVKWRLKAEGEAEKEFGSPPIRFGLGLHPVSLPWPVLLLVRSL